MSQVALAMLLEDDRVTLRQYLSGDRASLSVKQYYDRFGLELPKSAATAQTTQHLQMFVTSAALMSRYALRRDKLSGGRLQRGIKLMAVDPAKAGERRQDGRFRKGQSGNPAGKPRGTRNATTLALENLLDGQATALTQKAIDLAMNGDMTALRLCMDRILPPRKDRPVTFTLPPIVSAQDAAKTVSAVLAAVASGELTPADAGEISKLIEAYVKAFETAELAERLDRCRKDDKPMIARNMADRIRKLETGRQRPNEMLLVWRQPGASIAPAIAGAEFATGDKVICVEWFGDDPMPKPKWYSERLSTALGSRDYGFINQTLERLIGGERDFAGAHGYQPISPPAGHRDDG